MPKGVPTRDGKKQAIIIGKLVGEYVMRAYMLGVVDGIDQLGERLKYKRREREKEAMAPVLAPGNVVPIKKGRKPKKVAEE